MGEVRSQNMEIRPYFAPNPKGDMTMRFMMLVKHGEIQAPPPKEFLDAMAKLGEEAEKSGTMIASGGLSPIAKSARVRLARGQVKAGDGPFAESKEVVGGFAIFELKSKEEAIEGAKRFMELHKKYWPGWEGETEVRQIFGPEDVFSEDVQAKIQQMCSSRPA